MATIVNTSGSLNNKILKVVSKDYMSNKFIPLNGNQYSDNSTIKTLFSDVIAALGGAFAERTENTDMPTVVQDEPTAVQDEPSESIVQEIQQSYTVYKAITTSEYKKTGIYSALRNDESMPVTIDWGDGTVDEVDGNVNQKVHEYASVGEFTVSVSNVKSFAAGDTYDVDDHTWCNTTSQNAYTFIELVELSKTITEIERHAFAGCSNMASATIHDDVAHIRQIAFYECYSFFVTPTGVAQVDGWALGDANGTWDGTYYSGSLDLTGFRGVEDNAFMNCSRITSVAFGNRMKYIGYSAFGNCTGLTGELTIPNSVIQIDNCAFAICTGLQSVTIPDSVAIGSSAFLGCNGITSVTIIANGGNAEAVKEAMINAGISRDIQWTMP